MENGKAILKIELEPKTGRATVEIKGTPLEILFALTAITSNVCENIDLPTDELVKLLPSMLSSYKTSLADKESISFNPFGGKI